MATRSLMTELAPETMRVPFAAASVRVVRARLRSSLFRIDGSSECIDDARVIVSELVANSIRHARPLPDGTLAVSWCVDDSGLQISVTDGGSPTRPRILDAPSSALAGRGMAIVEKLSASWWAEHTRSRSTVHAVLSQCGSRA